MIKFIKKIFSKPKLSFIMGIILGITLTASGVYAASALNSKSVFYSNTKSSLSSTNIQDALDELYEKADSGKFCSPLYEYGMPTLSSSTNYKEVYSSTKSNIFIKKDGVQLSVCLYPNRYNAITCLPSGSDYYEENQGALTNILFSVGECTTTSASEFTCRAGQFMCSLTSKGAVSCRNSNSGFGCSISSNNKVSCS